jgi:hypothetical protein
MAFWIKRTRCPAVNPAGLRCTLAPHSGDDHWHADNGGTVIAMWGADFERRLAQIDPVPRMSSGVCHDPGCDMADFTHVHYAGS